MTGWSVVAEFTRFKVDGVDRCSCIWRRDGWRHSVFVVFVSTIYIHTSTTPEYVRSIVETLE